MSAEVQVHTYRGVLNFGQSPRTQYMYQHPGYQTAEISECPCLQANKQFAHLCGVVI